MPRPLLIALAATLATLALAQPTTTTTDTDAAQALLRARAPEHARTALLDDANRDPNDLRAVHDLAVIELLWLQDPHAAAFLFASLASDDPSYDRLHNLGVAHAQARAYDEAITAFAAALEHPASPAHHQLTRAVLADVRLAAGDPTAAAADYLALHDATGDVRFLYQHYLARVASGERAEALHDLRRLRDEAGASAPLLIATLYRAAGMSAYATHELERAREVALHDADFEAFTRASVLLAQQQWLDGQPEQALLTLDDVQLVARDPALRHTQGSLLLALGDPERAFRAFTRGERLDDRAIPSEMHTALLIGAVIAADAAGLAPEAFALARELEGRYPSFRELQDGVPGASGALVTLALAHEARGANLEALAVASGVDAERLAAYDLLRLGDLHYRAGQYDLARQTYERALAHPNAAAAERTTASRRVAYAMQAAGNLAAARVSYESHLADAPYDTLALHQYGWVLAAAGAIDEARDAWSTALARGHEPSAAALERTREY
ncbi:MAG: hypothetical protein WD226_05405 [Planctomycetota bacterium]